MTEPSERQVLYALVAAGFHVVTAVVAGAAVAVDLVPPSFGVVVGVVWLSVAAWGARRWLSTVRILAASMAGLVAVAIALLVLR